MNSSSPTDEPGRRPAAAAPRSADRDFAVALARAFGGALFFGLPLIMTMEMWSLGLHLAPLRVALLLVAFVPMLVGLTYFAGFEDTHGWFEDVRDAFVALFVGFVTASATLSLLGALDLGAPPAAWVGQITLEAVPASVGAALAVSLLGGPRAQELQQEEQERRRLRYGGELFLMAAGAIFFAFNIAPTEEVVLIAVKMTAWQAIGTALLSLLLMHAFVYAVEFHGQETAPEGALPWTVFARFSVVGYAIALLVSAYVLWTFGRYDGSGLGHRVASAIVLGLPASLGAAAARLVL